MGIGTTATACIDLGVNYLRIESNKEYVQKGESRINERNRLKNEYNKKYL
jgi:DNA modification methylase